MVLLIKGDRQTVVYCVNKWLRRTANQFRVHYFKDGHGNVSAYADIPKKKAVSGAGRYGATIAGRRAAS